MNQSPTSRVGGNKRGKGEMNKPLSPQEQSELQTAIQREALAVYRQLLDVPTNERDTEWHFHYERQSAIMQETQS